MLTVQALCIACKVSIFHGVLLFQSDILSLSRADGMPISCRSQAVTFNYVRNVYFFSLFFPPLTVHAFISFTVLLLSSVQPPRIVSGVFVSIYLQFLSLR